MDDPPVTLPFADSGALASTRQAALLPRWLAGLQVFLICGIPTQLVVTVALFLGADMPIMTHEGLSLAFVATVSLLDTALVAVLIRVFLTMSGENSADVFIGSRPVVGEMLRGLALLPVVLIGVMAIVLGLRAVAPWLHNVETNPLEAFMRDPLDAAIFVVVVVLAGGVREELQRAFILHRFEQRLGGAKLGLVIFGGLFAALHVEQGFDIAIAVGILGLLWGLLYLRRGSVILPMVNHAGFNAVQVLQGLLMRSVGG